MTSEPAAESVGTEITNADTSIKDTPDGRKSIAVLPFRDMSAAQDQGYFGEGIAEELLNALVKLDGLRVASRTSAFSLVDEDLDIPAIAKRLGVDHILEGSIRTSGQKVRVTAQLIEVSNDVHLWSETYDGSLDDIFKIQDEITGQITAALKVQLGNGGLVPISDQLTDNPEAYQLYLRGRHLWRQRNSAALPEAVQLLETAVELDPGFHRAWSNLAVAYLNLADYDRSLNTEDGFIKGLEAAEKALEIYPQSTEALIIKANDAQWHCDYSEAARLYEKAISLNPEDPTAHHWYAVLLAMTGRNSLALEQIQIARQIDPLISAVIAIEAEISGTMGDYTRADELYRMASTLGLYGGSLYPVGLNYLFAGEIEKGKVLIKDGWPGEESTLAESRGLFLEALSNPDQQKAFEEHIGTADPSQPYKTLDTIDLLSILGSAYVFEYQANLECPVSQQSLWRDSFREHRGSAEFFEMAKRAGLVDYWREYGWPDDCASLDQSLAECP